MLRKSCRKALILPKSALSYADIIACTISFICIMWWDSLITFTWSTKSKVSIWCTLLRFHVPTCINVDHSNSFKYSFRYVKLLIHDRNCYTYRCQNLSTFKDVIEDILKQRTLMELQSDSYEILVLLRYFCRQSSYLLIQFKWVELPLFMILFEILVKHSL